MNALTFASPEWFWGLLVILPLLMLRAWSHWRSAKQLPGLVSPRLASRLITGSSHSRRWVVFILHCLAVTATLVALARPQLGFDEEETETDARNLILAIDTSRSMMADDLQPNRLTRAKLAAKDIILSLPDDRVGLIAFAGKPFVQAPLTVDHEAVLEAIDQLDTEIIPRGGTNLSAAVSLALDTFKEAGLEQSALVIFSDGEALEGSDEVEKTRDRAAENGMAIMTVGVGTAEGAIIPEMDDNGALIPGLFVKDEEGQVVRTRLTSEALQSLSSRGGAYVHLGGKASLTKVVEQIQQGIRSSREKSEKKLRPIERFMWPLSAAVFFLILAHLLPLLWVKPRHERLSNPSSVRRLAASLSILLLATGTLTAKDGVANGYAAFERKDYKAAIEAYEGTLTERLTAKDRTRLHMSIGAAAYRLGNFERAAEAYGQALVEGDAKLRSQTHYNLGNTLFRQGEAGLKTLEKPADPDQVQTLSSKGEGVEGTIRDWEGAIEHFETTLTLDAKNTQAAHNLEVVKKRLEDLKKQQEEEKKKEEEEKKKDEEKKDEEKKDDKKDKEDNKDSEKQKGDGKPDDQKKDSPGDESKDPGQDPKDPGEDKPKDGQPPQDPKEGDGKEDPEKKKDSEKPEPGEGDSKDKPKPGNPGEGQPQEPEAPKDGELKADPNQAQPQNQGNAGQAQAAQKMTNPTTGYSPSEARQLLDSLADETEVRPVIQPSRGEKFKNW